MSIKILVLTTMFCVNPNIQIIASSAICKTVFSYLHTRNFILFQAENFVSDMGGQLGLWAGFSVLSLAELIELVMILFHACCTARKTDVHSHKEDT